VAFVGDVHQHPGEVDVPLPFPGSPMPNRQQLNGMAARIGSMLRDPLSNRGMKG